MVEVRFSISLFLWYNPYGFNIFLLECANVLHCIWRGTVSIGLSCAKVHFSAQFATMIWASASHTLNETWILKIIGVNRLGKCSNYMYIFITGEVKLLKGQIYSDKTVLHI